MGPGFGKWCSGFAVGAGMAAFAHGVGGLTAALGLSLGLVGSAVWLHLGLRELRARDA
jgi:hypothetical protein